MSEQLKLTCDRVRDLVEAAGKRWAVVIAGASDDDGGTITQFTTWGLEPADKVFASDLSRYIADDLCPDQPSTVIEDFSLDAAKNKAEVERLRAVIIGAIAWLERLPLGTVGDDMKQQAANLREVLG
jgi:hypothetical protein